MLNKILPLFLVYFSINMLVAQEELTLQLVPDLLQRSKTNPALAPDGRLIIGLSSFYGSYFHTGGSIGDLVDVSGGQSFLKIDELLDNVEPTNYLKANLELETINVHFRLSEQLALNFNHAIKSNNYLKYNETLPSLFWRGNAQYIGEKVEFGPDQQSFAYNEFGLGLAYKMGKLSLGAKVKWLAGIGDISTDRTDASLFTDDDIYQLTLDTDYRINTSTFTGVLLFDTLSGYSTEYGIDEILSFDNFTTNNSGFALDLGIQYEVTDKLSIGASIIDWGKINWNKDVKNFTSQGVSTFSGLDVSSVFTDDSFSITTAVDTLTDIFKFKESSNSYSTTLAPKIYVNASYQINDRWSVGGMYYQEFYRGENFSAIAISAQTKLLKFLQLGASYSVRNNTYDNIGFNVVGTWRFAQIYFVTDNILAAVQPYESKNVNLRLGLNIILGSTVKDKAINTDIPINQD